MPTPPPITPNRLSAAPRWLIVLGFIFVIPFAAYLLGAATGEVKVFHIPTSAMSPTIKPGDRIFAVRYTPKSSDLRHGQLVVFDVHGITEPGGMKLSGFYVKRIAALPGDVVDISGGLLVVNGRSIERNGNFAIPPAPVAGGKPLSFPLTVPADQVFLLGDNFHNSLDSRYFGPVEIRRIAYRPTHRVFPPGKL